MSLQLAAQHMASRGRGPDTTLVHMAPQEVAGLQALAKAHGGSLTINPDTGLPEAGFLSSILPLVAGAFLGPAGLGLTAMQAGLAAGALGTVATGSLKKGLMAGLGAYGGAGLASGLSAAGTGALSSAAGTAAANSVVPAVATEAVAPALIEGAGSAAANVAPDILGGSAKQLASAYDFPIAAAPTPAINAGQMVAQATPTITQAPVLSQQAADIGNIYAQEQAAQNAVAQKLATTTPMDTLKAGFGELVKDPKRFMTKENLQYGLAGLAPMMIQDPQQMAKRPDDKPFMYSYDPGRISNPYANRSGAYTGEVLHFDPRFTRLAAGGGLMDIGPVQAMSDRNEAQTLMANQGQMFAKGGEAKAVKPVEEDPYYTMSGQSGDMFKYLMGQMPAPSKALAPVAAAPAAVPAAAPATAATQSSAANTTMRPYTFDPITGTFTGMPIIAPAVTDPTPSTAVDYGSFGMAQGGIAALAQGGPSHLGDYSDGGRLLKGPGDGVSDSIPATIADKRPARLADGEFVVPARIVSELGNGSTEAGARKLYAMMDRVQKARKKSIGKNRVAVNSRAENLLPA